MGCVCHDVPFLMSVHWSGECGVYIGGCADEEEDHHEEGVEVEEGGL